MLRQRHRERCFGQERPRGIEMRDEQTRIDGGYSVVRTIVTNIEAGREVEGIEPDHMARPLFDILGNRVRTYGLESRGDNHSSKSRTFERRLLRTIRRDEIDGRVPMDIPP